MATATTKTDEEFSGSFEFVMPFTSTSYEKNARVRSPPSLIGECPMCWKIFPRGGVSAYVEVCPPADWWSEDWVFPSVQYKIEVMNTVVGKERSHIGTRTFEPAHPGWGFPKLLECDGYEALKRGKWVFPNDTVRFRATLTGDSLTRRWGKLKETNQYALMYKEMKYTDMHIVVGEGSEELKCHRSVLAACSPVFDRMFASSMQEGAEQRIVLKHVCPGAVAALLEYIYVRNCSEATLRDGQILKDLLTLADQYQLPDLVEQCARSLVKLLDTSNAYTVLQFLRTYGEKPNVREHFREAKRKVQQDESLFDAALLLQASQRSSEDADSSQPSKRPRTELV